MVADELPTLLRRAIDLGVTNPPGASRIHGEPHWKSVAGIGLLLARRHGVSRRFVWTFALLHDVMREDDGADPRHGQRAAELFEELVEEGVDGFEPGSAQANEMVYALSNHTTGRRADGPAGICWDADRLTLWRVGKEPDDRFLSTETARSRAFKQLGATICLRQAYGQPLPSWSDIKRGSVVSFATGMPGMDSLLAR